MELPSWVPAPLRDPRRAIPAAVALIVLIAAAVYLPSRSDDPSDRTQIAGEAGAATEEDKELYEKAKKSGGTTQTSDGNGRSSGVVTDDGGLPPGVGDDEPDTIDRTPYQGVTDKEIELVLARQTEPCGQDPDAIIQQALPNADPEASISTALKWFANPKRALAADLPESLLDKLGNGYYGRTVKPIHFTEDHGDFCPEQSRNDAKNVLTEHKPFAVIGGSNEWDEEATQQQVLKVTGRPATDRFFQEHAPYLWGPITGATTINRALAGYTDKYLAGKNSKATGDVRTASKKRVFGVVFQDTPEINRAKDEFLGMLKTRGVSVKSGAIVGYEPKLSTIAVQARNIIAQLLAEGVTTVLMLMDPIAVQFITQEADRQQPTFRPEWITNTYGLMDWSLGPRTFMSDAQAVNTFGVSAFWPSKQLKDFQTEEYKAWTSINPGKDVPSDFLPFFRSFKLFFRGVAMAGPELTPKNFERGYHAFCAPCKRGASYVPLTGYGPGDYTAVDDLHIQKYDINAKDYTAPRCRHSDDDACDEWNGDEPPVGAYVYANDGQRYTSL
jgi:hypothetical protein